MASLPWDELKGFLWFPEEFSVHFNLGGYPLVMTNRTMEHHHRNSGFFPLNTAIFPSVFGKRLPGRVIRALQRGSSSNGAGPPGASRGRGPGNRWMLLGRSSLTRLCRQFFRQLTWPKKQEKHRKTRQLSFRVFLRLHFLSTHCIVFSCNIQ